MLHFFQLSSSLKERLKRCGRYHSSPGAGTPQRSRLSIEPPPYHQSTDSRQSTVITLDSENTAKKLCIHNPKEIRENIKDDHSKIGSILSEKHQNQSSFENLQNQSISTKHSGETDCTKTPSNKSSNQPISQYCNSENICEKSDALLNTEESPVVKKTRLDTRTTPVSSRVVKRTDVFRGSRIDFGEKKTDSVPMDQCSIQKPVESKPCELSLRGIVTDSNACSTTGTSREAGMESSGMTGGSVRDTDSLLKEISGKEETLRKLKMVKMYQTKVG